jgi:hypothetical protein
LGLELTISGHQKSRKHNIFAGKASNPAPNSRLRTFWYFLYFVFLTSYKTLNCPSYSRTPPMIS